MGLLGGLGGAIGGQQIAVLIRGIDDLTNPMGKAEKAMRKFNKTSKDVEGQTKKTNNGLGALSKMSKGTLITMALLPGSASLCLFVLRV